MNATMEKVSLSLPRSFRNAVFNIDPVYRNRTDLAYELIEVGLGLTALAERARQGLLDEPIRTWYGNEVVALADDWQVPDKRRGHVQLALHFGLIKAEYDLVRKPPTGLLKVRAYFRPERRITTKDLIIAFAAASYRRLPECREELFHTPIPGSGGRLAV